MSSFSKSQALESTDIDSLIRGVRYLEVLTSQRNYCTVPFIDEKEDLFENLIGDRNLLLQIMHRKYRIVMVIVKNANSRSYLVRLGGDQ